MVTPADAQQLRQAQRGVQRLVERDLRAFWGTLDLNRPGAARDALLGFVPELTRTYGDAAATVAADWYDDQRAAAGATGRYRAQLASPASADRVQQRVRYGAGHLFTPNPEQTLVFLDSAVQGYVAQPGRLTIRDSALADPAAAGWQRVTQPNSCKFCRMLAGRGGVYKRETATFASHDDCNCAAVPSWDPDAPEVGVEQYQASVRIQDLRDRAAEGSQEAQRQLDAHRSRVREFVADMDN